MAAVFLAEHMALRRRVALKILHPPPDSDESGNFEKRFRLEAETLATLDHPNIVTLYDYGEAEDGRFYLAMEYIDGPRYTDILGQGALAPDRAIQLLLQVCAALRYAHKRGVIHRDLKPSNLLIRTDGDGGEVVKVVDFGLVKVAEIDQALTREGLVLGSPHCMAPEQVRGGDIDHRADIYAIGVLLFRSLTGAYPFHGATSTATMVAHLNEPVPSFATVAPDLRVPARLEAVVRRCLAKRPDDRYPDVKALMEELAACVGMRPEPDSSTASLTPPPRPVPAPVSVDTAVVRGPASAPDRRPLYAGIALLLLLALAGVFYAITREQPPVATTPPETPEGAGSGAVETPVQPPIAPPEVARLPEEGKAPEEVKPPVPDTPPAPDTVKPADVVKPIKPRKDPPQVGASGGETPSKQPVQPVQSSDTPEGYMGLPEFDKPPSAPTEKKPEGGGQ